MRIDGTMTPGTPTACGPGRAGLASWVNLIQKILLLMVRRVRRRSRRPGRARRCSARLRPPLRGGPTLLAGSDPMTVRVPSRVAIPIAPSGLARKIGPGRGRKKGERDAYREADKALWGALGGAPVAPPAAPPGSPGAALCASMDSDGPPGLQSDSDSDGRTRYVSAAAASEADDDGVFENSPWDWKTLNLSTDMGPDMICLEHFLAYEKKVKLSVDNDVAHMTKNAGKCALKNTGLWPHQVTMTAAQNCVYGSTLSPARLQQISEAMNEYFEQHDHTEPFFQMHLHRLVEQLDDLGVAITDANCAEVVLKLGLV